jgi:antitoxin HigA-1
MNFDPAGHPPVSQSALDEFLEQEFMIPRGLNQTELAEKMGVDRMRVSEIIRGERAITADTALRLAAVSGTTPRFWLGLQSDYDLAVAAKRKRLFK